MAKLEQEQLDISAGGAGYALMVFATNGTLTTGQQEWDIARNMPSGVKGNGGVESGLFDMVIYGVNVALETAPSSADCEIQIYENVTTEKGLITVPIGTNRLSYTFPTPVTISSGNFWWPRTKTDGGATNGVLTFSYQLVSV